MLRYIHKKQRRIPSDFVGRLDKRLLPFETTVEQQQINSIGSTATACSSATTGSDSLSLFLKLLLLLLLISHELIATRRVRGHTGLVPITLLCPGLKLGP